MKTQSPIFGPRPEYFIGLGFAAPLCLTRVDWSCPKGIGLFASLTVTVWNRVGTPPHCALWLATFGLN